MYVANLDIDQPVAPFDYYDVNELNCVLRNQNKFIVFHHNIRSFNRNFDCLAVLLNQIDVNIDIIVLTETWFTEGLCAEIDNYIGYHVCRPERGGGVCLCLSEMDWVIDSYLSLHISLITVRCARWK